MVIIMPASIEKTYADALFGLITEERGEKSEALTETLNELELINSVLESAPELSKLMNVPTVSKSEKQAFLESIFKEKVSPYTFNFLRVLTDKGRIRYFGQIYRQYLSHHNDIFGITDITVTTAIPLDSELREKVKARMEKVTGKIVNLTEKVDKTLIGGIVLDYDGTRLDGSVKTRLDVLKQDIAGTIA